MGRLQPTPKENIDHHQSSNDPIVSTNEDVSIPPATPHLNPTTCLAPTTPHPTQLVAPDKEPVPGPAVVSSPPSRDTHALSPNNQLVVYVQPEAEPKPSKHHELTVVHGVPEKLQYSSLYEGIETESTPHQPVVVTNAPNNVLQAVGQTPLVLIQAVGNPWTTGLFDCFQHPTNAIITALVPCVTFGQIAEVIDNGSRSCVTGSMLYVLLFLVICHWNIGVRYRFRLRNAYQLAETPVTDRIAHVLFPLCALCQEFRELKNRGYDPFLGYRGIIAQINHGQNQQADVNNPPMNQFMMR